MKRKIILGLMTNAIAFLYAMPIFAQNVRITPNMYKDGDKIEKQQVTYLSFESVGKGCLWNINDIEEIGTRYDVEYYMSKNDEGVIVGRERNTLRYFEQHGDTLLMSGYENRMSRFCYDRPKAMLHFPITFGDKVSGVFHGSCAYAEEVMMRVFGTYMVDVDATGSLVLPDGDTLRNVKRVHVEEMTCLQHLPNIVTERQLKNYIGSVCVFSDDSIRRYVETDSAAVKTDKYQWYAKGYRYPVYETVTTSLCGGRPVMMAAYYCSPQVQEAIYDKENEVLREQADGVGETGDIHDKDGGNIRDLKIKVDGGNVYVEGVAEQKANVKALVCDVSGIVFKQGNANCDVGESFSIFLDCSGLRSGEYVLYIEVNGQMASQKVKF